METTTEKKITGSFVDLLLLAYFDELFFAILRHYGLPLSTTSIIKDFFLYQILRQISLALTIELNKM